MKLLFVPLIAAFIWLGLHFWPRRPINVIRVETPLVEPVREEGELRDGMYWETDQVAPAPAPPKAHWPPEPAIDWDKYTKQELFPKANGSFKVRIRKVLV